LQNHSRHFLKESILVPRLVTHPVTRNDKKVRSILKYSLYEQDVMFLCTSLERPTLHQTARTFHFDGIFDWKFDVKSYMKDICDLYTQPM